MTNSASRERSLPPSSRRNTSPSGRSTSYSPSTRTPTSPIMIASRSTSWRISYRAGRNVSPFFLSFFLSLFYYYQISNARRCSTCMCRSTRDWAWIQFWSSSTCIPSAPTMRLSKRRSRSCRSSGSSTWPTPCWAIRSQIGCTNRLRPVTRRSPRRRTY